MKKYVELDDVRKRQLEEERRKLDLDTQSFEYKSLLYKYQAEQDLYNQRFGYRKKTIDRAMVHLNQVKRLDYVNLRSSNLDALIQIGILAKMMSDVIQQYKMIKDDERNFTRNGNGDNW